MHIPLALADAEALPFASGVFDIVFTAFGAVPFVADSGRVMREAARVLRPGGRWVFSVTHPMRWIFPDDPGDAGLVAINSYFDRTPYVEYDDSGTPTYVEHHRTLLHDKLAIGPTGPLRRRRSDLGGGYRRCQGESGDCEQAPQHRSLLWV